jgi:hypothetical protein
MNYVIAVFSDQTQSKAAYSELEKAGLPIQQVSILGDGYPISSEFGFIDPKQPARQRARFMAFWLVPFGCIGGIAFNLATQYQLLPEAGQLSNLLLGGLLGAVAGAMGSFFVGGGIVLTSKEGNAVPYNKYLKQGKYLVVVRGAPNMTNKATRLLRQFEPENLQGYIDPTGV